MPEAFSLDGGRVFFAVKRDNDMRLLNSRHIYALAVCLGLGLSAISLKPVEAQSLSEHLVDVPPCKVMNWSLVTDAVNVRVDHLDYGRLRLVPIELTTGASGALRRAAVTLRFSVNCHVPYLVKVRSLAGSFRHCGHDAWPPEAFLSHAPYNVEVSLENSERPVIAIDHAGASGFRTTQVTPPEVVSIHAAGDASRATAYSDFRSRGEARVEIKLDMPADPEQRTIPKGTLADTLEVAFVNADSQANTPYRLFLNHGGPHEKRCERHAS
jgi:hypothetical protein